jgi:hypothetical protein
MKLKTTCPSATLSTTNPTWTDPGSILISYCSDRYPVLNPTGALTFENFHFLGCYMRMAR